MRVLVVVLACLVSGCGVVRKVGRAIPEAIGAIPVEPRVATPTQNSLHR